MKKLFYLPALAAALFFTSCSSDEPAGPNNGEVNENGGYLAVNIMAAGGSRATSSATDFEDGTPTENEATKGLFLFYDDNGNPTQTPQLVDLTWPGGPTDAPQVEKISKAVVVVAGKTQPTQMLVILNPGNLQLAGLNLETARNKVADYATGLTTKGSFIMTNSAYALANNSTLVKSTSLKDAKFYESEEAATEGQDAVQVYVERVVAKIETSNTVNDLNISNSDVTLVPDEDGQNPTPIEIEPVVNGIEVANVATTSFLFKNINNLAAWNSAWDKVNDFENKRCYWAGFPTDLKVANHSWNDINGATNQKFTTYVQENTQMEHPTAIIVAATLTVDGKAQDLIRWSDNYYQPERFKSAIATFVQNGGFMVKETVDGVEKLRSVKPEEVDYITDDQHEALVKAGKIEAYHTVGCIADDAKTLAFVKADGTDATVEEINTHLQTLANRFLYWKGGKTYYYVNIEHFGDKTESIDFGTGVVRNHIYRLTLNSISGLGTPVFNPKEIINPQKPDDKIFRMRAQINILKWRIVNQTVDFGK